MRRPPLRTVAELAGVSEPTVSRVLNGRRGVAASTRARVTAAVNELGFDDVPDVQSDSRQVVGVVCAHLTNPVFPTIIHHVSTELGRHGYLTNVAVTDPQLNPEERCLAEFVDRRVDALVLICGRHAEVDHSLDAYRKLLADRVPLILVNGRATDLDTPHIYCDEEAAAKAAVTHLARLGHSMIGCVLGPAKYVSTHRFCAGYSNAMAAAGLDEPPDAIARALFTLEGGRAAATRLIERGFTAIVAGNDLMALGALQAATKAALRVPHDLSVVGYDGTEFTTFTDPPLTTLRQPFEDMAHHISAAVVSEIANLPTLRDHYVFEPVLAVRGTTHTAPHRALIAGY